MDAQHEALARSCLLAAHDGAMDFPTIVERLSDAGFDGYVVDYRRNVCTYYLPDGDSLEVPGPEASGPVAALFQPDLVAAAVREAQAAGPGYTYAGFCAKVRAAGCAGYFVSFLGRRVTYFGRTAETHVELFPR